MLPVTENASSKRLQNTMEINVEESLTKTEVWSLSLVLHEMSFNTSQRMFPPTRLFFGLA